MNNILPTSNTATSGSSILLQPNKNGFTLVEILVVFTIIALLFGVGLSNYRGFARRQAVRSAARQVEADINLARQMANTGKRPYTIDGDVDCPVLNGYGLVIDSATKTKYSIRVHCSNGWAGVGREDITLPLDITLRPVNEGYTPDPYIIYFKALRQGMSFTESYRDFSIASTQGISTTVRVTSTGQISIR